jgi:Lipopolysaccharide export system permease LptF/LptG
MPWLLHRYILAELLKVMILTTGVLVTVIAFGAAIKPLSNDDLFSAGQTAKYIGLAIVPMLQFALPFACGFAATVVLHRLATDNEVAAAAASGISQRRLLLPIVVLGLVLGLIMVGLTQSLIPTFWKLMQRTITRDVTRLFERSIESHRPFVMPGLELLADSLIKIPHPQGTAAQMRYILSGMVAAEIGDDGRITTDATSRQAVIDLYIEGDQRLFQLVLLDVVAFNGKTGELGQFPEVQPRKPIVVRDTMKEGAMFLTRAQLQDLRRVPDGFGRVAEAREELAAALREQQVWEHIDRQLRERGVLQVRSSEHRVYTINADRLQLGQLARGDGGKVEIIEMDQGTARKRFLAGSAAFRRSARSQTGAAGFDLALRDVRIEPLDGGISNEKVEHPIIGLVLSDLPDDVHATQPSATLLGHAASMPTRSSAVDGSVAHLQRQIHSLLNDISSTMHQRYALSATAPLLLVLGAVLAVWLRGSLPLTVYLWAFLPSIANLMVISGGSQMVKDGKLIMGPAVVWSGNVALLALLLWVLSRVSRN